MPAGGIPFFGYCPYGGGANCVVDGDTFRLGQRRVRLVGIDAPELKGAQCAAERALGERAADRLLALVNGGGFDLVGHRFHDRDTHGRDLRLAQRGDVSFGDVLVDEGLARRYLVSACSLASRAAASSGVKPAK